MQNIPTLPASLMAAEVLSVQHWTDRLFSFTTSRDPALRFENGQFIMLGLMVEGRPLLRAYSIASANHEPVLEFLSIKVAQGPLTSRLQAIRPGDRVILGRKPTGTLLAGHLLPGRRLYMISTGTGLAPFLGLVRDPGIYDRFDQIVLTHGSRQVAEFAFAEWLSRGLAEDPLLGEMVRGHFRYLPHATREAAPLTGRITTLIQSGRLAETLGLPALSPEQDRVMICGSEAMLAELKPMLEANGFREGSSGSPGHYVIEKAFVAK